MTLTKADLIDSIYNQLGLCRNKSIHLIDSFLETIKRTLENGEDVLISGFGKFSVKEKNDEHFEGSGGNAPACHQSTGRGGVSPDNELPVYLSELQRGGLDDRKDADVGVSARLPWEIILSTDPDWHHSELEFLEEVASTLTYIDPSSEYFSVHIPTSTPLNLLLASGNGIFSHQLVGLPVSRFGEIRAGKARLH